MSFEGLFTSIEEGDVAGVKRILAAEPQAIQARNEDGLSPVLVAAYWGQEEVLECLLQGAVGLDFWEAATVGATDRVRQLIDVQPSLISARSPDGFTALHLASFFGHAETVRALIAAGADVLARTDNALSNQPLHAAAASSQVESRLACARHLLDAGADVNDRQSGGFTPLMSAAQSGDRQLTELLLAYGADPGIEDDRGLSARDHAAEAGHADLAAELNVTAD
jgi:ankyrin repeat protein